MLSGNVRWPIDPSMLLMIELPFQALRNGGLISGEQCHGPIASMGREFHILNRMVSSGK